VKANIVSRIAKWFAAVVATLCACVWIVQLAHAQALPIGPDFPISQGELLFGPRVAIDDQRWFVVGFGVAFAWLPFGCGFSDTGQSQGCHGLEDYGYHLYSSRPVDVAAIGVDDFMLVWEVLPALAHRQAGVIRARRMSAHAVLLTEPFTVTSSHVGLFPREPRVAVLPSSNVVVVWVDGSSDGTDDSGSSIQARYFSTDGLPLGPRIQVNTTILGDQDYPDVAAAPDGSYAVTWTSESSSGSDTSGRSVQLRRFGSDGLPMGDDQQVNSYTDSDQNQARIDGSGDGGFVVVWASDGSSGDDDSSLSIQARLFDENGMPLGPDFQVNSYIQDGQDQPAVGVMDNGGFEVVWTSLGSPGDDDSCYSVQRQAFDANGAALGLQQQVNTTTEDCQDARDVAMTGQGDFVVVWSRYGYGFWGRIYCQPIFADGFESGDTSLWSVTPP